MATLYVSQTATNGLGVGSDSYSYLQAQNKDTPYLTHTAAMSNALSGDTILLNDGIYTSNLYMNVTQAVLIVSAINPGNVTIRPGDNNNQALRIRNTVAIFICTGLTFDRQNNGTNVAIDDSGGTGSTLIFHTCIFTGGTVGGVNFKYAIKAVFDKNCQVLLNNTYAFATSDLLLTCNFASSSYYIDRGIIIRTGVSAQPVYGIHVTAGTYSPVVMVTNCNIQGTLVPGGPYQYYCIEIDGALIPAIAFNTCNIISTDLVNNDSCAGISVSSIVGFNTSVCNVYNNYVSESGLGGYGIKIGDDDDTTPSAGANTIFGIAVYNNYVTQSNHGIFMGWVSGAQVFNNTSDNMHIGVIGKHTGTAGGLPSTFRNNTITNLQTGTGIVGQGLRAKGGIGDVFEDNIVYYTTTNTDTWFEYADTESVGIIFRNNTLFSPRIINQAVIVLDTSTATFVGNNYYSTEISPFGLLLDQSGGIFEYQTNNYTTFASWIAAHESTALSQNPNLTTVIIPTEESFVCIVNSVYTTPLTWKQSSSDTVPLSTDFTALLNGETLINPIVTLFNLTLNRYVSTSISIGPTINGNFVNYTITGLAPNNKYLLKVTVTLDTGKTLTGSTFINCVT